MYVLNTNLINTMKKLFLLVVLWLSLLTGIQAQFPKAIFPGDYPDPSILRDGKDYYMTHSPFYYAPGFLIPYQSMKDLLWHPTC